MNSQCNHQFFDQSKYTDDFHDHDKCIDTILTLLDIVYPFTFPPYAHASICCMIFKYTQDIIRFTMFVICVILFNYFAFIYSPQLISHCVKQYCYLIFNLILQTLHVLHLPNIAFFFIWLLYEISPQLYFLQGFKSVQMYISH